MVDEVGIEVIETVAGVDEGMTGGASGAIGAGSLPVLPVLSGMDWRLWRWIRAWGTERGVADVVVMRRKTKEMYTSSAVKRMDGGSLHRGGACIRGRYDVRVDVDVETVLLDALSVMLHEWLHSISAVKMLLHVASCSAGRVHVAGHDLCQC